MRGCAVDSSNDLPGTGGHNRRCTKCNCNPTSFGAGGGASACSVNELSVALVSKGGRAVIRDDDPDDATDGDELADDDCDDCVADDEDDSCSSWGDGSDGRMDDGTLAADSAIVAGTVAKLLINKSRTIEPT